MNKKNLTERDICTKFLTPAVHDAGWDVLSQIREQVHLIKGRIIVRAKLVTRGKAKFADCILYYKPNIPIALIEAKDMGGTAVKPRGLLLTITGGSMGHIDGLPQVAPAEVEQAGAEIIELVQRFCGGRVRFVLLALDHPSVSLAG